MNRRTLVGLSSTALASSLAGCSKVLLTNTQGSPEPHIDPQILEDGGWTLINQEPLEETVTVEQFGVSQKIDIQGRTDIYDDKPLRQYVAEQTLGQMNDTVRTFFTTKLEMDPNPAAIRGGIADGLVLDNMESIFRKRFISTMEGHGITDIKQVGEEQSLDIDTGATARYYEYSGVYDYDEFEVPITDQHSITLPGGSVKFNAAYALWISDGFVLAAGGGYPSEDISKETSVSISDAISGNIDIELDLHSDNYGSELKTLIQAVE